MAKCASVEPGCLAAVPEGISDAILANKPLVAIAGAKLIGKRSHCNAVLASLISCYSVARGVRRTNSV